MLFASQSVARGNERVSDAAPKLPRPRRGR